MRMTEDLKGPRRGPHGHHGHGPMRGRHEGFPGPAGFPPFGPTDGPGFGPGPRGRGRRGAVRQSVLVLLSEEPRNGYQLMQQLAERTQGWWKPSPGAIYPALSQLEDEGLIETVDLDGQKAYQLTEAGSQAAAEVGPSPWERQSSGHDPQAMHALWQELGGLASALKELARVGGATQLEQATGIIATARRQVYGLLANEPESRS